MSESAITMKNGETVIQTDIIRSPVGLRINVHAHTRVEDFIRQMGSGELIEPRIYGRYWESVGGVPLMCYDQSKNPGILTAEGGIRFRMDRPGHYLIENQDGGSAEVINISFLRLSGISSVEGVTFDIRGVFSKETARRMRSGMDVAQKKFYDSYLKPFRFTTMLVTQENVS